MSICTSAVSQCHAACHRRRAAAVHHGSCPTSMHRRIFTDFLCQPITSRSQRRCLRVRASKGDPADGSEVCCAKSFLSCLNVYTMTICSLQVLRYAVPLRRDLHQSLHLNSRRRAQPHSSSQTQVLPRPSVVAHALSAHLHTSWPSSDALSMQAGQAVCPSWKRAKGLPSLQGWFPSSLG
jgi:hypothetical protein